MSALKFKYVWLKDQGKMRSMQSLCSLKVAEASSLCSKLDFLMDNLFLIHGQSVFKHSIAISMGTNCAVFLANFYGIIFICEFSFLHCFINSSSCTGFVLTYFNMMVCRYVSSGYCGFLPLHVARQGLYWPLLALACTINHFLNVIVLLVASLAISWISFTSRFKGLWIQSFDKFQDNMQVLT